MKISVICKALVLVLATIMLFGLVACAPQGSIENGFLESIPEIEESSEEPSENDDSKAPVEEGHARAPEITAVINVSAQELIITGICEEGCSVTITDGETPVTVKSIEGHFVVEYTINTTKFAILSATAFSDTLEESTITTFRGEYNSTAMKRSDGLGVTIGADSHFYYDTDLDYYVGTDTLLTQTEIKEFKEFVNIKVANFLRHAERTDVKMIYVLIPNSITMNPENLAEGTVNKTYKTRYEQVVEALKETDAYCIDMKTIFADEKAKGNKLYYDTDSHLTEYGGYLVYKAICDVIDDTHPAAKARDLATEFTVKDIVLNGGNTTKHLGLDSTVVTEASTLYTPKFSLRIGNEDSAITTASGTINKFGKYSDSNSMYLASGTGTGSSRMLFATGRTDLPCALIYRDDFSMTFFDILAERFNRCLLAGVDDFTINLTDARRYYGVNQQTGENNNTVDYIIVIVNESNLGDILK